MCGNITSTFVPKVAIYYTVQFIRTLYNLITKILRSFYSHKISNYPHIFKLKACLQLNVG